MTKNFPYFQNLDKKKHLELARKGGLSKRSFALQKAWDDKDRIKELDKTMSRRKLAGVYGVSHSSISRIVNSG